MEVRRAGVGSEEKGGSLRTEMSRNSLEKHGSIDAQLRLLAPAKVSEDDKLVEYDALLVDRFLDILQSLHGEDLRETVPRFSSISSSIVSSCPLLPIYVGKFETCFSEMFL